MRFNYLTFTNEQVLIVVSYVFFIKKSQFLATQNKEQSKTLLQGIPQLPKALFQVIFLLIVIGLVNCVFLMSFCT
jgi:hypothetical protein